MKKTIIKLKDYKKEDVYYNDCEYLIDIEKELEYMIEEQLIKGIEPNRYAIGYDKYICGDLNIVDALRDVHFDEGYEGIEDHLDFESEKLKKAQSLIDEWLKENEQDRTCYYKDEDYLIDISELIEDIKKKIEIK